MNYKYHFDPSSKKFICPSCEKRRFVRMIDESGNYISDEYGICERKGSCGYSKWPKKYDSHVKIDFSQNKVLQIKKGEGPPSTISEHYVQESLKGYDINSLYQYLITEYNKQDVDAVFALYKVGTSRNWNGATVFWQISIDNQVRSGKIIKFDSNTGKRIKDPRPLMTWVHTILKLKDFNLKQVLFGEHLLSQFPNKTVCVVESEKTTIIMAIKHPNYLWLATGAAGEFKAEKIRVLVGRKVVVFPDTDFHNDWIKKTQILSKQFNLNLIVSSFLINETIALDHGEGYDLADFKQIEIDNANLTPLKIEPKSPALKKMLLQNPNLAELIRVFDLELE